MNPDPNADAENRIVSGFKFRICDFEFVSYFGFDCMRIGITYDLKSNAPAPEGLPDDFQEEFDSPVTIEAIASVLRGLGHTVEKLGDGREMLQRLLADPPDFVFNFAE